jgi:uncharacterized protein
MTTRRNFLKRTLVTGIAVAGSSNFISCSQDEAEEYEYDLNPAMLGKTGVVIPRISVGLGSRFCSVSNVDEAVGILNYALDNGLYSWDTAHGYRNNQNNVISEQRAGIVLKDRRDEVFITTKIGERDPEIIRNQVNISLQRLQSDYVDVLMIHNVESVEDVDRICEKGSTAETFIQLKKEGLARFIGFSCHSSHDAVSVLMDRIDFDVILMAMDHHTGNQFAREKSIIPKAVEKGTGIMLMKVVRPAEHLINFNAQDLIRYALSIEGPASLVLGMDSIDVVKSNVDILKTFKSFSQKEMNKIRSGLIPVYEGRVFDWMQQNYSDVY